MVVEGCVVSRRLETAILEFVEALREVVGTTVASPDEPERLLDVDEARRMLGGIARSTLYQLIDRNEIRSLTIGRRRLIPSSAIAEYVRRYS